MGTAASLCVRPERCGMGMPFPGEGAVRGCAQECGARLRGPRCWPRAGMPPSVPASLPRWAPAVLLADVAMS